jgi:hypothetical protein
LPAHISIDSFLIKKKRILNKLFEDDLNEFFIIIYLTSLLHSRFNKVERSFSEDNAFEIKVINKS